MQIPSFHYTMNLSLPGTKMRSEEHLRSLDMQTSDVLKKDLLDTTGRCSFGSFHLNLSLKHRIFQKGYVKNLVLSILTIIPHCWVYIPFNQRQQKKKHLDKQKDPWEFSNGYRTCMFCSHSFDLCSDVFSICLSKNVCFPFRLQIIWIWIKSLKNAL